MYVIAIVLTEPLLYSTIVFVLLGSTSLDKRFIASDVSDSQSGSVVALTRHALDIVCWMTGHHLRIYPYPIAIVRVEVWR